MRSTQLGYGDDGYIDAVARVALAIQRAGGDHLGDVESIHADMIHIINVAKRLSQELDARDTTR